MVERIHRILSPVSHFKHDLSVFWGKGYAPWALVGIMIIAVYFVLISKLSEIIVGGF